MIREVDLISYLPPFIAEYKQVSRTLEAENPEFRIVWEAANRVLYNEFIATADEYGIGRYEKMLKIYPSKEDTLESRRARVQARWISCLPYTERMLLEKLISLCGKNDFRLIKKYDCYRIELEVSLELFGQVEELERIVSTVIPCNMVIIIRNKIPMRADGFILLGGGVCAVEQFSITNDKKEQIIIKGSASCGGTFINTAEVAILDDLQGAEKSICPQTRIEVNTK
ncbi:MAG: DUF2313 domain-containing protein [Lachnospiraceae bacterium]|jgi:hypothetical protein|nr:DUF2313 domain-containing protein [Lachnospiraceae bacterium]